MTERDLHDIIYTYPNDLILGEMFRRAFLCIKDSRDEPKEEELKPFIEILKNQLMKKSKIDFNATTLYRRCIKDVKKDGVVLFTQGRMYNVIIKKHWREYMIVSDIKTNISMIREHFMMFFEEVVIEL